ncbi:flotillin family protein [Iamia sp. SCSIO 61187]|uniref:flotillin family protein n=1 Tax=Iamia sp. SCSIO 61187 TaxID=2722752 RepID=UPI001C630D01|nr:flotillin family protein [Iamia sp. SCSIO 61187]QYG92501.1 flotillin family protein [Iamia sp. SCSIO 61187]
MTGLIAIAGLVVLIFLLVMFVLTRIKVAGPNEAFIVTGRKGREVTNPETGQLTHDLSGQKVVMGASTFVLPVVQRLAILDLTSRQLAVSVPAAIAKNGIRCSLEAVAVVKVGGQEDSVRAAAQRFLGQQQDIDHFTKEVLAGALRAIVGRLTVEEIIRDRATFAAAVTEEAESSLTNQGLVLDTFQLQDIQAEGNYLADLGRPEAARAQKDAAIAEAIARREAEQARILAEEEIAVANRTLELKRAEIQAQTDAAAAEAAAAGPLAQAAKDQDVISAQEQVATRRAQLKDRELDTEIRKPADARRYAVEQDAEAERSAAIARAEAQAQEVRLQGEAQRTQREQLAEAVRAEGQATADATRAAGEAEASAMQRKADAYASYGEAAILDLLASALPGIVGAAAEPMGNIDKLTVISTEGASDVTRQVTSTVAQGMQVAGDLTGFDVPQLLAALVARRADAAAPSTSGGSGTATAEGSAGGG